MIVVSSGTYFPFLSPCPEHPHITIRIRAVCFDLPFFLTISSFHRSMAHTNYCRSCGVDISSQRSDSLYCGEKCSKRYRRRVQKGLSRPTRAQQFHHGLRDRQRVEYHRSPDKVGQVRTTKRSKADKLSDALIQTGVKTMGNILETASIGILNKRFGIAPVQPIPTHQHQGQRLLSDGASASSSPVQQLPSPTRVPLVIRSGEELAARPAFQRLNLPEEWSQFLGDLPLPPFTMLVWGMNGSGKSSWSMRFLRTIDEYSYQAPVSVYCSAEEDVDGATVQHRQQLTGLTTSRFINRLPMNTKEWKDVLSDSYQKDDNKRRYYRRVLVLDSMSVLDITPQYFEDAYDYHRQRGLPEEKLAVWDYLAHRSGRIYIAHATKDGKEYIGASDWAHDVDIVIECVKSSGRGQAIIRKNRFIAPDGRGSIDSRMNIW